MATTTPPRYISLAEAARRIGLSERVLTRLIENCTIEAIQIMEDHTLTSYMLDERMVDDMARKLPLRDRAWQKASKYQGETITAYEARMKYKFPPPTLYRLIRRGLIKAIDEPGLGGRGRSRRLDKAHFMYWLEISKHGAGVGHRLIRPDTIPPYMADEYDD